MPVVVASTVAVPVVVLPVPFADMVIWLALTTVAIVAPTAMSVSMIAAPTSAEVNDAVVQVTVLELVETVQPLTFAATTAQAPLQNSVTGDGNGYSLVFTKALPNTLTAAPINHRWRDLVQRPAARRAGVCYHVNIPNTGGGLVVNVIESSRVEVITVGAEQSLGTTPGSPHNMARRTIENRSKVHRCRYSR